MDDKDPGGSCDQQPPSRKYLKTIVAHPASRKTRLRVNHTRHR